MPRDRSDAKLVWDMLDVARYLVDLTSGQSFEAYAESRSLRMACERGIEIIGEAARGVSDEFRRAHPDVAWSAIIATRHIISHEYDDVQDDKVWRMLTTHVPRLVAQLEPILRNAQQSEEPLSS